MSSLYTFLEKENKYLCNECGLKFCHRVSSVRRHCKRMHNFHYKSSIVKYPADTSSEEEYHPPKLTKFNPNTFQTEINKNLFLKCCVGLVAVKNIPFRIFDDEEFFKVLMAPYEKHFATKINSRNIGIAMENACSKIRTIVHERLQEKLVSIKIDIATRMDKTIVGINVQYMRNLMICVNTLGMIQVRKGTTATHLKDEILRCLEEFGIDESQIYSNTADNGVNVLKAKTILQDLLQEEGMTETSFDMTPADLDLEECLHKKIASVMPVMRCAAHSIHLAAHDVLKTLDLKIKDVVLAVRKMRTGDSGQRMPTLGNDTRWNSTFDMLCSLQGMKLFIHDQDAEDDLNHIDWDFITNFIAAFEPLAMFTRNLQFEQYILGDFYRDWWMCEIELEDLISKTPYAEPLRNAMQNRRKVLLQNDAFLAAMYLDPRFNFENSVLLTHDQKISALQHLVKTYNQLRKMETGKGTDLSEVQQISTFTIGDTTYTAEPIEDEPCTSSQMYDKLEQRIAEKCNTLTAFDQDAHQTLKEKLLLLCQGKKYPLSTDVLDYWRVKPYANDIKKLVEVVLSVPATQISAERSFSALSLVLTKQQTKMNDKTISDVLLSKLNFDLIRSNDIQIWD